MKRMVVHYVDSADFGGNEQALLHLLRYSDRDTWEPVLFHHDEPGIIPLLEEVKSLDVRTRVVPRLRGRETLSGFPTFLKHLRGEGPTIFHAHLNWLLSCKYGLLAAKLARVPAVVATLQQYLLPPWGMNTYLQQRRLSSIVDQYIAVSHAIARQLCQDFRVPSTKIEVIHNSVPVNQYWRPENLLLRAELDNGSGLPIILTVARLDDQKGHTFLLEAMVHVPDAILVLAGNGPNRTALEALGAKLGVSGKVRFLGYRKDIPDLLACCDLFVLPSLYEGLPLSILEAMAAGKPIVATSVGGTPEAVLDGKTGVLVPPGDPEALANSINRLLSDPITRLKIGQAALAHVQETYSFPLMIKSVANVYEDVLKKHGMDLA